MVDVLINCLLNKNKEMVEELALSGAPPGGGDDQKMTDDDGGEVEGSDMSWKAFYEHPLTAATTAMLNVNGAAVTSDEQNSATIGLLYECYKMDKYAAIPELWTSAVTNSQSSSPGSLPVSLLPQAGLLKGIRRLSETATNDIADQEVDIYLTRDVAKRRNSTSTTELLVPSEALDPSAKLKNVPSLPKNDKLFSVDDEIVEKRSISPLPPMVQVKQEPSPQMSPTPSPSSPNSRTTVELPPANTVIAQAYSSHLLGQGYDSLTQYVSSAPPQYPSQQPTNIYMVASPPEYREAYYTEQFRPSLVTENVPAYTDVLDTATFVDRYIRQAGGYKGAIQGLCVDLSSPDSGIGETTITPRETAILPHVGEIFDYSDLSQTSSLLQSDVAVINSSSRPASSQSGSSKRSWQEYGRNAENDKVQISKLQSDVGFRYFLESPISTSQRREDDRITYVNKGQFYGITLEYIPDPAKPLKSTTVKTVILLMFREEKPCDEELKAWKFWHSRQHSTKQRILDADTKNSSGIIGQIDEITHNGIAFYWSPLESTAKVNVAVQCLSTDFSNQKGVKGLPLHLQIDTYDDFRENAVPHHRGYCQIKVFCDKGAERKTRDEERRASKRKLTATGNGRKKLDEMYHLPYDRSEFYSMSDLLKPPVLFTPNDEDKGSSMEINFYPNACPEGHIESVLERRDTDSRGSNTLTPPLKRLKVYPTDRVLLYARQESECIFHALHIQPPSLAGLAKTIENKYKIRATSIRNIYKRCKKGYTLQLDDDLLKHYANEDACLIEVTRADEDDLCDILLFDL